ncbi:hypothetical protein BaRGS_00029618 [Batillaria attramentaria]|uniref:NADH dehydrogenase [ubiquinone] 1 alpha subcomplex subunit 10, mitochondrial n=1 Tax=Batillaria attramentaria TaxID=370345 RepID=A0ABD0JWY4_9CAEN
MALIITRAASSVHPHARQLVLPHASRLLPGLTQVAHLTSTHGEPAERKYAPWPYKKRPYNEFWQFFDHTRKRFDDNSKIILVEGNLAVGKSAFAQKLAHEFDMAYIPDFKDTEAFITGENFDKRSLNEQLPARVKFCDIKTFYEHKEHPLMLKNFGRTLLTMYMQHFLKYAQALEHLLNTGQGVVMERGVYSHTVFYNVLRKVGQLSPEAFRYLNFVYDNTICEMWRPHLVIYLDAPVDYVRKQITRRANLWEVGSPIITDEFLKLVETTYKEKYLPQMRKYSDVMTVDMVDLPDWDMLIEDLEKRDLDTQPFDEDDKFKDWQSEFEDDFNRMRMDLAKKWQVENRFSMALPYDAPELIVHIDDYPIYKKIVEEHPEVKYRPGYNPDKYNVMLKW